MSELLIIGFNEKYKADEVMLEALKEEQESLADLEDVVVVTKNAQGKIRVKPYYDIISAIKGHKSQFWGTIVSSLLEESRQETLSQMGITQQIRSDIKEMLKPNTSALFLLVKNVDLEKAKTKIQNYQGTLLQATLYHDNHEELFKTFSDS